MPPRPAATDDRAHKAYTNGRFNRTHTDDHAADTARTVLVIDAKSANRLLLKRLITAFGHVTILAEDGPQGVEKACTLSPDVILMDVAMPGLSGVDAMRQIRDRGVTAAIVACGALENPGGEHGGDSHTAAGFDGCLSKPVDALALARLLRAGNAARQ